MRRARGFSGLEIIGILVAIAALVGAVAGLVHLATSYVEGERTAAFKAGEDKKDGEYKARDNEQLAAAHKQIVSLLLRNQDLERQLDASNRIIEAKLLKEKEDAKKATATVLARLDDDDLRLRDGVIEIAPCPAVDGAGGPAKAGGVAGGPAKASCARFSRASRQFLVGILAEGDDAIRERNACVAIALSDRAVINGLTAPAPGATVSPPIRQP